MILARVQTAFLAAMIGLMLLSPSYGATRAEFQLMPLPSAAAEAKRMDRDEISDEQPSGLYLNKNDSATIIVTGLRIDHVLAARIGFPSMWEGNNSQQIIALINGRNVIKANNLGPLMFIYTHDGTRAEPVSISVNGASPMPLFIDGQTSAAAWEAQLSKSPDAPFVSLVSSRSMITMSMRTYLANPIDDPAKSFATVNQVINWEDEIAGFDSSQPVHRPTPLRVHYIEDIYTSAAEAENFYMYQTKGMVGMTSGNTRDLTDPRELSKKWGIWHETGHTHQQKSWTWSGLTEINVNVFSLFVQYKFGEPSRLYDADEGSKTTIELARDWLAGGAPDYTSETDDGSDLFIKLVMFHQLKEGYGWNVFADLHKAIRENPLSSDASDSDRVDRFVTQMCNVTGNNLLGFFEKWGLVPSDSAIAEISAANYSAPESDPSKNF